MTRTVLLTGAAGGVGTILRPMLRDRYERVILSDRAPLEDPAANEESRPAELTDLAAMAAACDGADGLVHLGGQSVEAGWDTVDASNIQGMMVTMEAARAAGIGRVVFASSNHAVGMYPRRRRIDAEVRVRPDSRYGLSKVFGEGVCALYADKHAMRCLSIRIGNVADRPADARRLSMWLHPEDLMRLVVIGLEHPGLHHEVVYGASDCTRAWWDNAAAHRLGYRPAHRAEDHVEFAMGEQAGLEPDPVGDLFEGGGFASAEFDGDLDRTLWS